MGGMQTRSLSGIDKDAIRRCFYTTTTMREVPGREPNRECVGENYIDVHSIGKKTTRYLDFQYSLSPLTRRDSCKYQEDYIALPLGDNKINSALAQNFKERGASGGKGADTPMDGRTKYEDDYLAFTTELMKTANQPNQKPPRELTKTLGGSGKMMEVKSHEQRIIVPPNLALAKSVRAPLPRPGLDIGGAARCVPKRTFYQREFGPEQAARSIEAITRSASTPQLDTRGAGELCKDPRVFGMRRFPYMMPGK